MNEKVDFSVRLKQAMLDAGYPIRPSVLEREFNTRYWGASVTLQAVRRWLRGEAIPSQDKLQVLAEWLKVEPEILRFGEAVRKSIQQHKQLWETGMSINDRHTIEAFLSLSIEKRKLIADVVDVFVKSQKGLV